MYSTDGDFGKVRMAHYMRSLDCNSLLLPTVCGWHKCNDLYHIHRTGGGFEKHLIFVTVSGTGSIVINNKKYSLPAGSIALAPRNTEVSYCTPKGGLWEFYWIHPSDTCNFFIDAICEKGNFVTQFDPSHNYRDRIEKLIRLISEKAADCELNISLEMSTILHYCAMDLDNKTRSVSLAERAYIHITQNFKEYFSLAALSGDLFVSTAHLIRSFKKKYGYTPHQFLISYRLSYSIELLKFGNMQIEEIASAVGFSSASHYISAFKEKYGCTPGQYNE